MNALALCICWIAVVAHSFPVNDEEEEALYLQKFGYFDESNDYRTGAVLSRDAISNAIKDFQRFAGLNQTGELDNSTIAMMKTPRCGMKDRIDHAESTRKKRYALQGSSGEPVAPEDDQPLSPPSDTSHAPDLCQDASIDAVTQTQDGSTYVFKGEFYWKILSNGIADGYPRWISEDWNGLEGNLDAALTWSNGKTFFFKGGRHWRFTNKEMDSDYPKLLNRGFEGIPDMLDAALVWSGNGKTYFFKGDKYWRYPPDSERYPKLVNSWKGLPLDGIDAAFQWENNRTYFFKRDKYYTFNDISNDVDTEYPRSTSVWWFGCKSASHNCKGTNEATSDGSSGELVAPEDVQLLSPHFCNTADIVSDTSHAPDLCQDASIDAVTRTQDGSTYVFKGEFYWKILSNGIADGYPSRISEDWNGLEGKLDAALTLSNGKTFFFKGGRHWRFTNKQMDSDYPRLLNRGFEGMPDMLDAALVWSGNGKIYFFKGDKYWKYPADGETYPQPLSLWKGLPADGIDAALQWENNRTYFFKGDKYYLFNDISSKVDITSPLSTSEWWFGC